MKFFNMYFQSQMYFSYCSHVFVENSIFRGKMNYCKKANYVGLKFEIDTCFVL
jgi:hypothetical protein